MNAGAAARALELRMRILAMHQARTQAMPRLTRAEIRRELDSQISDQALSRHLGWLRAHGHLPPR